MPDQTKTRGLQLALNSLDSALKVIEAMRKTPDLVTAINRIKSAKSYVISEMDFCAAQQPRPYVGEERREKE